MTKKEGFRASFLLNKNKPKSREKVFFTFFFIHFRGTLKENPNTEDFHLYKDEQRKQMNNQTSAPSHPTNPFHMTQSQRWTKLKAVTT